MRITRIGWKQGRAWLRSRRARRSCSRAVAATAAARSTTRPRPTSRRPPRPATAARSTWRSTRGSATRPSAYVVGAVAESSSAARSTTRSSRRTSPGRASAPARSTSSSRTGATRTWRRSSSRAPVTAARWTSARTATSASSAGSSRRGWPRSTRRSSTGRTSTTSRATSPRRESGGKGQFLGADPSYVQFDEAIISNLGLDFKVVFSGSEAASITAFQQAEENKEFLIGYFYEPQWLFAEVPLERVALPPYEEGCQDDPAKVDCDYPETTLKKIVSTSWVEEGGAGRRPGAELRVDQRRPEPRREVHLRGRHGARGRRRQVGRGEPGQGRRPGSPADLSRRTGIATTARPAGG